MSTGETGDISSQTAAYEYSDHHERQETPASGPGSPPKRDDDPASTTPVSQSPEEDRGSTAQRDQPSEGTYPSTEGTPTNPPPSRQVIAVSASKGPAAFFNLARKFLVTDETCDLSALEGAIVSAVDAAHLLERSKLATIVRVQTSYVTVEPKRRKQSPNQPAGLTPSYVASSNDPLPPTPMPRSGSRGKDLRRARIVITVQRTESYKQWLDENPLQAIIAGDGDDELAETTPAERQAAK